MAEIKAPPENGQEKEPAALRGSFSWFRTPHGFFRGVRRPKRFGSRRFRRGPRGVVAFQRRDPARLPDFLHGLCV